MRAAPVDERAGVERGEADGLGQADRLVERRERGRDVAPVDLERAPGVPDPHLLERVARLLGEPERPVEREGRPVEVVVQLRAHADAVWAAASDRASPEAPAASSALSAASALSRTSPRW